MTSFKRIEVRESIDKYGATQRGIYALENIKKEEMIRYCECGSNDHKFTRDQLLDIIEKQPQLEYFIRSFSYMINDDVYKIAFKYLEQKTNDECSYFNHSCNPNCGFDTTGHGYVAIKDINAGDELTYHYGWLETEASLIYGLNCRCGNFNCEGKLSFSNYRNTDFVKTYFQYFTPYLQQKVTDMQEKWYSEKCYVKRILSPETSKIEDCNKVLASLLDLKKDELVAKFSTNQITIENHFLTHSIQANCYIINKSVYAKDDIQANTILSVNYLQLN